MAIEPIAAVSADIAPATALAPSARPLDFASVAGAGLARVDTSLQTADALLRQVAAGQAVPVHELMIAMERARLDLTLAAEVRNRLVDAYQELTRMQL
jgi:flagellar hook-basal body complex protein FliE